MIVSDIGSALFTAGLDAPHGDFSTLNNQRSASNIKPRTKKNCLGSDLGIGQVRCPILIENDRVKIWCLVWGNVHADLV